MSSISRIDPNGLYRIKSIIRTKGGSPPFIDVCAATWWGGVKSGRFPKPVRSGNMTFWRGSDLLALVDRLSS